MALHPGHEEEEEEEEGESDVSTDGRVLQLLLVVEIQPPFPSHVLKESGGV